MDKYSEKEWKSRNEDDDGGGVSSKHRRTIKSIVQFRKFIIIIECAAQQQRKKKYNFISIYLFSIREFSVLDGVLVVFMQHNLCWQTYAYRFFVLYSLPAIVYCHIEYWKLLIFPTQKKNSQTQAASSKFSIDRSIIWWWSVINRYYSSINP